ncbi:MAG: hypothetical protein V3V02_04140 [Rhizobiaceae bacterium]
MKSWFFVFLALFVASMLAIPNSSLAGNRYALVETEEGTMRLDKHSGAITYCRKVSGGIACSMAADEREAWVKATEKMADRVDELEKRLAYIEALSGVTPTQQPIPKVQKLPPEPLASKSEGGKFDGAVKISKEFLRRVIGAVKELK